MQFFWLSKNIQSNNSLEYKNSIIKEFCELNSIQQIFISPQHPQSKSIIEVSHKKNRRYILNAISSENKNFNLIYILLDVNYIHNYNIRTVTKFRPADLITNTEENIYNTVINNINKKYKKC